MADSATLETPAAAAPAASASPTPSLPEPPARLTVPASALGLETSLETKPSATPAPVKPAEPTETVPASKPAAEPATPAATAKPAAAAAAPAPEKIKIGDKEYTVKELEALVAKPAAAPAAPAPKPAATPAAVAPAPLTAEQIAAQKADIAQREQTWVDTFIKKEAISFPVTEDEMETILSGGKGAVELFGQKLSAVSARTALLARKSMYEDLEPMIQNLKDTLAPLLTNHLDVSRVAAETQFSSAFPDLKPHMSLAREIAQGLEAQFPNEVKAMSQEQFGREVAAQVDSMLQTEYKRWFPTATDTWREKAARDAAEATAAATAAAATAAAAAAAAAAPAKPRVQAPASNSPAAIAASSTPDFHKSVAKDLCD